MSDAKKLEKGASKSALTNGAKPVDSEDEGNDKGSGSDSDDERKSAPGKAGAPGAAADAEKAAAKKKQKKAVEDDKKEGSYELIAKWLSNIDKTIDKIMDNGQTLPPVAWDDLRAMRQKVEAVQRAIARSDVAALLELEKVNWDWVNGNDGGATGLKPKPGAGGAVASNVNDKVAYYRAAAMKTDHKKFEFKAWHMPQYFSDAPLPPHAYDKNALINANVKLPEELKPTMERCKVSIGVSDTAVKTIASLMTKLRVPFGENDYVLKARGTNEYFEGAKPMFSYAYVRKCIRDAFDIEFSLVKRPTPSTTPADEKKFAELAAEYRAKVDPKIIPLAESEYQRLTLSADWTALKEFPMQQLNVPFRVMVCGVENCVSAALPRLGGGHCEEIYVESFLFHGMNKIDASIGVTSKVDLAHSPRFMQWLGGQSADTQLSALPRETKIAFLLWGRPRPDKSKDEKHLTPTLLGWVVQPILNERGVLVSGSRTLRLWGVASGAKDDHGHGAKRNPCDEPDFFFRATTREENLKRGERAVLRLDFGKFVLPVVAPLTPEPKDADVKVVGAEKKLGDLKSQEKTQYDGLIVSDTLERLTPDHKRILWQWRHTLKGHPKMLPKFLQSVNWGSRDCQLEAHKLMNQWAPPMEHVHALQLLDARFPDFKVREYAVNVIGRMRDNELSVYLLQLVQCLKFEPYHDSPLTRFLIERAIANPLEIGHPLFWLLKAEMHTPEWCERFGLIIEEYLSNAGPAASHLRKQLLTVHKLQKVAEMVVRLKPTYRDEDLRVECRKELEKLNREFFSAMSGSRFQIPFNPRLEATTLIVEKCRYMSSKMVPLWLLFKNVDSDAPPIYVLFKSGDDLRQDILTLQLLRVMDSVWLGNKCDLKMRPYAVVATGVNSHGKGVGMLEVVTNADTTAGIQNDFGGGAMGALKSAPIDDFIRAHNKENYEKAVETFLRSCAGYCVATFVLGIGDRHNGNIMVTKAGSLFHIDFGHFLGNFKKKKIAGVNFEREKAAFVFTKAMAFVMGGQDFRKSSLFKRFLNFCFEAFKTLRKNADTLENLFALMIPAGMPELIVEKDIDYLRKKLVLQSTEKEAESLFSKEVDIALDHTYRAIDNMIHIWKNA